MAVPNQGGINMFRLTEARLDEMIKELGFENKRVVRYARRLERQTAYDQFRALVAAKLPKILQDRG